VVRVLAGSGNFFLFTTVFRLVLEPTQPPIQCVQGALTLRVKEAGLKADHSPPSIAEVKNAWSYTSIPQYALMALCSVEAQEQLYLTLPFIMNQLLPETFAEPH
jgi:hypothetical protein